MTAEPLPQMTAPAPVREVAVPRPAPVGRRAAVVCLTVGATLNLAEALIARIVGQSSSVAGSLDAWAAEPVLATTGLVVGTIAVPFLMLGLVAMAQLVRPRMPRLGGTAMVLAIAGGLGFYALHAVGIFDAAAVAQPDREAGVAFIESAQNSPLAALVLVPFLLGMAGSVLLTSIGYLRTRVVPLWIPVVFLAFLALDFGGFPTGPVDPHWLFVAASFGVAVVIAGLTDRQWWLGRATDEATA